MLGRSARSEIDLIAAIQDSLLFEESVPEAEPDSAPAEPDAADDSAADTTTSDAEGTKPRLSPMRARRSSRVCLRTPRRRLPTRRPPKPRPLPPSRATHPLTTLADDAETTDDDLAAAIAAAHEQVGTDATLDDIAPGTTHIADDEDIVAQPHPLWSAVVAVPDLPGHVVRAGRGRGVAVPADAPGTVRYETQEYTLFVFGGLVLAAAGVILILAVWLGARLSPKRHRAGLFTSAFIKGASFTPSAWWCGGGRSWRSTTCASAA